MACTDLVRYNEMLALADQGLTSPDAYARIQRYVDLDNLIDFFLIHQYTTNKDGPEIFQSNNQRAIGSRVGDPHFRFFVWDMEYSLWNATDFLNIEVDVPTSASHVYTKLRANPEFRLRYADRAHKHLFNDGALTPGAAMTRWVRRSTAPSCASRPAGATHRGPDPILATSNGWRNATVCSPRTSPSERESFWAN